MEVKSAEHVTTLDPIEALRGTREELPEWLRERILAQGAELAPALLQMLEDDELSREDSPAEGWPPIHAVDLLAELRAQEAILPLLAILRDGDFDEIILNRAAVRLADFGPGVLEPALEELSNTEEEDRAGILCSVLSALGVRDERIWVALTSYFEKDPVVAASALGRYGDERALPLLDREIRMFASDPPSFSGAFELRALTEAYEQLAGDLPDDLFDLVLQHEELQALLEPPTAAPQAVSTKVGRNEPCPCGSGRKYKKCCGA